MDDLWKRVYRGDSGVPHSDPRPLVLTWTGSFALASVAWLQTHTSKLAKNLQFKYLSRNIHFFLVLFMSIYTGSVSNFMNLTNLITDLWSDKAIMIDQQKWKTIFDKKKQKKTTWSNANDSPTK